LLVDAGGGETCDDGKVAGGDLCAANCGALTTTSTLSPTTTTLFTGEMVRLDASSPANAESGVAERSERWAPYRTVASWYLRRAADLASRT
jgi:hypothetical protein